jgi:hypothetical protein
MNQKRRLLPIFIMLFAFTQHSLAQIGYQVSLLNSATGTPRAGETVSVSVTLTNCESAIICTEEQTVTTNDLGVLSLVIGNAKTFANVDWGKLPFFISASIDGKLIGKPQVLAVPVAEYAKKTGELTLEKLVGTWTHTYVYPEGSYVESMSFSAEGKAVIRSGGDAKSFRYYIDGNQVHLVSENPEDVYTLHYIPQIHKLIISDRDEIWHK